MHGRTPLVVLLLVLALAAPAAAHHGQDSHAPPEDPEEPDPCACDPVPPGPVVVEVGDGFECVGASSGTLTVNAVLAIVTVRYCKPMWGPVGP